MGSAADEGRPGAPVDDEARWQAYQAWLRRNGDFAAESVDPGPQDGPAPADPPPPLPPTPPRSPRRLGAPVIVALLVVAAVVLGIVALAVRGPTLTLNAPDAALRVQADASAPAPAGSPRALPCFVDGRPVGEMSLGDCGRRNGVASGRLDVGLAPAPPTPPRVQDGPRAPEPGGAVSPEDPGPGGDRSDSRPDPAETDAPPVARPAMAEDSVRAVRRFYSALADGDFDGADDLLAPEQRGQGALAAARLARLDPDAPLRVTEIDALGPSSVLVRYEIPDTDGDICLGSAHVDTTVRGDETLVRSVRAIGGC